MTFAGILRAAEESIAWIKALRGLVEKMGRDRIAEVIQAGDAMAASAMLSLLEEVIKLFYAVI